MRMPLIELGRTMVRMVCQRVAPRFQQASRNDIGTAARASRVLVMITGSVITARVQEAASSERPIRANSTKAPTPNRRVHDAGHAGQVHHRQVDDPREPVVAGVFVEIHAREDAHRGGHQSESSTRKNVPTNGAQTPAGRHAVVRVFQDERQRQRGPGLDDQVSQDRQHGDDQGHGHGHEDILGDGFINPFPPTRGAMR